MKNLNGPCVSQGWEKEIIFRFPVNVPKELLTEALVKTGYDRENLEWQGDMLVEKRHVYREKPRWPDGDVRDLVQKVCTTIESMAPGHIKYISKHGNLALGFEVTDNTMPGIVAHMNKIHRDAGVEVEVSGNVPPDALKVPTPANLPLALQDYQSLQEAIQGAVRNALGLSSVKTTGKPPGPREQGA